MKEILASLYVGKSYGKENSYRTLHFIYVTKNSVICNFSDIHGKLCNEEYNYKHFKECYGYDIKEIMFNRDRKEKIEEIKRLTAMYDEE